MFNPNDIGIALLQPTDPNVIKQLRKGGAILDYIPVAEVIARLNGIFGWDGWSEVESSVWRDESDPDWICARVVLEVMRADGFSVKKHGYGGEKLKRTKAGEILDLGDALKGAHSDALKKAATQLGIGLDLARDEDLAVLDLRSAQPKATEEEINQIQESTSSLSDEATDRLKKWWKSEGYPAVSSGELLKEEAAMILLKIIEISND